MESLRIDTTLDSSDYQALIRAVRDRMVDERASRPWYLRMLPVVSWFAIVGISVAVFTRWPHQHLGNYFAIGGASFLAGALFFALLQRGTWRSRGSAVFVGPASYEFRLGGFTVVRSSWTTEHRWTAQLSASSTPTHVFLWLDKIAAYTIRVADLPAPMTGAEVVARLRAFIEAAPQITPVAAVTGARAASADGTAVSSDALAAPAPPAEQSPPAVADELLAVFRLETRGHADPAALYGRDLTILILGMLGFATWIGFSRLDYSGEGVEFYWYGLPMTFQLAAWPLLVAWVLSRTASPRLPIRCTLLLTLGAAPWALFGSAIAGGLSHRTGWLIVALCGFLGTRMVAGGLRSITGRAQWRAVLAAATTGVLSIFIASRFFFGPSVWYQPDAGEDETEESAEDAQLGFEQSSLIDARIAAMAPSASTPSNYFIGFAGFGEQRVFAEEIGTAARVIGDRYDTRDRELRLVNDARDAKSWPLASPEALRHALIGIGKRMHADDVLFLSLSSHGGEDATLSVSNERFELWNDLTAEDLSAMLDESGIRNRVIVISACHAGSFLDALKDDDTIVLTAAAKEKTSFGCSDDRDLTYFGEAFYRDALPTHPTLRAAFDAARVAIAGKERAEGIDASNPQAWYGKNLEAKLGD